MAQDGFPLFVRAFEAAARSMLNASDLSSELATDGPIEAAYLTVPVVRAVDAEVWGQGFPAPVFDDVFEVVSQHLVKEKHLKLTLVKDGKKFDAIQFNTTTPVPRRARIAFRAAIDEFNGTTKVGLHVEAWEAA